jgi:2-polyprenyl-6-methoxyphenol hydroxylase-like FAD-dependent oxidoreductase
MVDEAGVRVVYEKNFSHAVSKTDKDVTIAFADGVHKTHDLVVGADGIYSAVRRYLFPDIKNSYAGRVAIAALAPMSAVKVPYPEYPLPASIQDPHDHTIIAPLSAHDSVCPVATGYPLPELDRKG